jgi:hypothetical protein
MHLGGVAHRDTHEGVAHGVEQEQGTIQYVAKGDVVAAVPDDDHEKGIPQACTAHTAAAVASTTAILKQPVQCVCVCVRVSARSGAHLQLLDRSSADTSPSAWAMSTCLDLRLQR